MKNPKIIVFDLDGTIVDSKKLYINTIHHNLVMNYFIFTKGHVARALGPKLEDTLQKLRRFDPKTLKRLKKDINEYVARESSKLKLCPKVKEVLKYLRSRKFKIVLLTNSARKYTLLLLKKNNLLRFFDKVIAAENFNKKSEVIKKIARKYKVKTNEIVYIADKIKDIKIAKQAHCRIIITLACSWDKTKFRNKKANYIIKNLGELKNVV